MGGWENEWVSGWVGGWEDGWGREWVVVSGVSGWVGLWMNEWVDGGWEDGWVSGWMSGWMVGERMGGWVDGWVGEWMDEWMGLNVLRHFLSVFSQIYVTKGSNFLCLCILLKDGVSNIKMAHPYAKIGISTPWGYLFCEGHISWRINFLPNFSKCFVNYLPIFTNFSQGLMP